jgi:outer membrane protein assembly factor BamB
VWAFFGTGGLACFTKDGRRVWQFNVEERYGKINIQFGMASTPVLDVPAVWRPADRGSTGGRLYLQLIHGEMRSKEPGIGRVVCLDAATGSEVWAVERPSDGSTASGSFC